jgi:hypothetical protein
MRLRELFVPTDFLKDPQDVTRYLSLTLASTSKARRAIQEFLVTVPDGFLYRPYQQVSFHDGLSTIDDVLQVQASKIVCSAAGDGDVPMGTNHMAITLSGLYNTLIGACSCL